MSIWTIIGLLKVAGTAVSCLLVMSGVDYLRSGDEN